MFEHMSYEEFKHYAGQEESCCTSSCMVMKTLQLLGGKWRLLVLYQLAKRPSYRFGELRRSIPNITNTMLTNTLRELEEAGLVHREQFNEIPPHVEYSITDMGKDLFPVFFEMARWGSRYFSES